MLKLSDDLEGKWPGGHKRVINYTGVLLCTKGLAGVQCQPLWLFVGFYGPVRGWLQWCSKIRLNSDHHLAPTTSEGPSSRLVYWGLESR